MMPPLSGGASMKEMNYIRKTYNVPAKRGMLVYWLHSGYKFGEILSARNGRLWIRFEKTRVNVHPTDNLVYFVLNAEGLYEHWMTS
jgi:hypothetical protein